MQITLTCNIKTFNSEKFPVIPYDAWFLFRAVLTLEQAELLCGSVYEEYHQKLKPRARTRFEQRRQSLHGTITHTANQQLTLSNRLVIFTARKRSLGQGNIFSSVCQEFCSQGGVCLSECWDTTPLRAVHAGRYGQQAGGMHPTGMQSCFQINSRIFIVFELLPFQ